MTKRGREFLADGKATRSFLDSRMNENMAACHGRNDVPETEGVTKKADKSGQIVYQVIGDEGRIWHLRIIKSIGMTGGGRKTEAPARLSLRKRIFG